MNIKPQAVIAQWRTLPNTFEVNVWNFETKAGSMATNIFKNSFFLMRFNSSGSTPWAPRKDRKTHPLLRETGSMYNSIKWKRQNSNGKAGKGVTIYTDPDGYAYSKRNTRGICYAAIHNAPGGTYPNNKVQQRQFMGHSSKLEDDLKQLSHVLFQGFPK